MADEMYRPLIMVALATMLCVVLLGLALPYDASGQRGTVQVPSETGQVVPGE